MKTGNAIQSLLFTLLALLTLVACSQQPTREKSSDSRKLDAYLTSLSENQKMMTAVYVSQNGETLYEFYSGSASLETNTPLTASTKFRIGSITKTFTSILIMQLIEDGRLSLNTPLETFYPEIPNAESITIKQLLNHRSGIASFTDQPTYVNYMTTAQSQEQMERRIQSYASMFEPNSQHQYSNSNYVLLGFIIESLYEKSYADVVSEKISIPLNFENTYFGNSIEIEDDEASSYRFSGDWQLQPETHMSVPHAAGAMVSTAKEANAFIASLFAGNLVSDGSLEQMITLEDGYGLGLFAMPFYDRTLYGHNGGIDGFVSNVAVNPEDGIAITVLSNGVNFAFNDVLIAVLSHLYDRDIEVLDFSSQPIDVSMSTLEQLTGVFGSDDLPLDITISIKNKQLMAMATGQSELPLTAYSATEFRFEPAGIVIEFDADSLTDGKIDQFTLDQAGGKYRYTRE